MKHCHHTRWLDLQLDGEKSAFFETNRSQVLTKDFHHPETQNPRLLVLIGKEEKRIALRALFSLKRAQLSRVRRVGEIHLHIDSSTIFKERPILLAEGCASIGDIGTPKADRDPECHEVTRHLLQHPDKREPSDIYTHLLFPFVDVFCLFSKDLGGLEKTARYLATWLQRGHSSTLPKSTRPNVIIVAESITPDATCAFIRMLQEQHGNAILEQFSTIEVIVLSSGKMLSNQSRYRALKECILKRSDDLHISRMATGTMFSVAHMVALLQSARKHFLQSMNAPFDVVQSSRTQNPVALDLEKHLFNFVRQVSSSEQLMDFAAPMVASSLFLDSYPPDAHSTYWACDECRDANSLKSSRQRWCLMHCTEMSCFVAIG
jgi:hypothetical protein